jgi:hypothetical protein
LEELLSKVTHKFPQMTLKLTWTLSQQTQQQDPFLRWNQSRPLDVSLQRYSDNASPEVAVSPTPKPGAFSNTTAVYPSPKYHPLLELNQTLLVGIIRERVKDLSRSQILVAKPVAL